MKLTDLGYHLNYKSTGRVFITESSIWEIPKHGVNFLNIYIWGGGGGGGAGYGYNGGGGGASGQFIEIMALIPTDTIYIVIGKGGKGGDFGINNGDGYVGSNSYIYMNDIEIACAKGGDFGRGATLYDFGIGGQLFSKGGNGATSNSSAPDNSIIAENGQSGFKRETGFASGGYNISANGNGGPGGGGGSLWDLGGNGANSGESAIFINNNGGGGGGGGAGFGDNISDAGSGADGADGGCIFKWF